MQQQQQAAAAAGGPSHPAAAKLLMDVDTAELLGLMPPAPGSPTSSGSFGSSGSAGSGGGGAGGGPGAQQRQPVVPLWFDEQLGQQMQASLVSFISGWYMQRALPHGSTCYSPPEHVDPLSAGPPGATRCRHRTTTKHPAQDIALPASAPPVQVESYQLWHLARRRIKAAEVAALSEADLMERRTSRSETDLTWLEAAAREAVAAADAELMWQHGAAGAAGTAGNEGELQSPFAPAPGSPLAPVFAGAPGFSLAPDAPLVLRSNSLAAPPGSPAAAAAAGASRQVLQKQRSLPVSPCASLPPSPYSALPPSPYASLSAPAPPAPAPQRRVVCSDSARAADDAASVVSEDTLMSLGGGSVRRVSFGDPASPVDPLASPRRRLPPLRKQVSLPPSRGGIPRSPASASSGQAGATPSEPGSGRSVARSISASSRPPLPRSALLGAVAGSSSSRTVAPSTPRLEDLADVQALPRRRRAPGELVGSPETRWRTVGGLRVVVVCRWRVAGGGRLRVGGGGLWLESKGSAAAGLSEVFCSERKPPVPPFPLPPGVQPVCRHVHQSGQRLQPAQPATCRRALGWGGVWQLSTCIGRSRPALHRGSV